MISITNTPNTNQPNYAPKPSTVERFITGVNHDNTSLIFDNEYAERMVVNLQNLSGKNVVLKDLYPIGDVHLLIINKANDIGSLGLIPQKNEQSLKADSKSILETLKKIYPNRDIYYVEHGSGNIIFKDGLHTCRNGKCIDLAHGHFIVTPKGKNNKFSEFSNLVKNWLTNFGWKNIETKQIHLDKLNPDVKKALHSFGAKFNIKKPENSPYLLLGEFNSKTKKEQSLLYPRVSINGEMLGETPSQLFRIMLSKIFYDNAKTDTWDWKKLLSDLQNNIPLSKIFTDRIESIRRNDALFEKKLKSLNMLM